MNLTELPDLATRSPLWLSLLTVAVNAVLGALEGYHDEEGRWDLVGVTTFALLMGLGGGFVRDVLLGRLPAQSLRSPWYLVTVLGGVALVLVLGRWLIRLHAVMVVLNALALGLFAVTGAAATLALGLPVLSAVLIGVCSAVGGGMLVSVLQNRVPTVLVASAPNALLAVLACTVYVALVRVSPGVAGVSALVAVVLVHLVADRRGLTTRPARP